MPKAVRPSDLVSQTDIADRLGVTQPAVAQWIKRGMLPAPWGEGTGERPWRLWRWADVEAWAVRTGRFVPPPLETENGCLEWQGPRKPDGYGWLLVDGRVVAATRWACKSTGPSPTGCWPAIAATTRRA